jgi:hypothetical protein
VIRFRENAAGIVVVISCGQPRRGVNQLVQQRQLIRPGFPHVDKNEIPERPKLRDGGPSPTVGEPEGSRIRRHERARDDAHRVRKAGALLPTTTLFLRGEKSGAG